MKRMIRLIALLLTMLSAWVGSAYAQDKIKFTYDTDGNRTSTGLYFEKVGEDNDKGGDMENTLDIAIDTIGAMHITMYPNPAKDRVMLMVAGTEAQAFEVTLMTATGVTIDRRMVCEDITEFDLSQLASGFYLISLVSGDERHVWKIVKR